MVVDEEGNVWLKKRVTIKAQALSTKLVEATMIVMALEAVLKAIRKTEVTVQKLWAWSDSLEAIQSLASGQLQQITSIHHGQNNSHGTGNISTPGVEMGTGTT